MDRVFIFLASLAALLVLCQWFVFAWVRRYLFQRYQPISRKLAYAVLGLIAVLNFAAIQLSFDAEGGLDLSFFRRIASVAYFSYLGATLMLGVLFLVVGLAWAALRGADLLGEQIHVPARKSRALSTDQRGFLAKPTRKPAENCEGSAPGLCRGCSVSPDTLQQTSQAADSAEESQAASLVYAPSRRQFLKWGTAAAVALTAGEVGKGLAEAYESPVVDEFDLLLPGLQGLGEPLTILQVTDFHYGLFMGNSELQRMVDVLNTLDGDMVVITGDLFHSPLTPIGDAPDILRGLRERRMGNVAVMGNHDFYAGEHRSVDAMRAGGLNLLRNSWITVKENGPRIHVGGIDDPMVNWMLGTKFPHFEPFRAKAPQGPGVRIVLSHRPSILPFAAEAGYDFIMAGHIHGGQIIIPVPGTDRGLSLASAVSKYTRGWYTEGRTHMYLNRGIGLTFIPWRINCPPEIAVVHLKPGQGPQASIHTVRAEVAASTGDII
jgi:predicted MPP superfamily phosphohydrolase